MCVFRFLNPLPIREVWVRVLTSVGRYDLGGVGGEEEVELGGYHVGTFSKFLARNSSYR